MTFIEGNPVVIDSNVELFDAELDASGNYDGATLSIARTGAASSEDVFDGDGFLLTEGQDLVYANTTVGTVVVNSGGELELEFNSNATRAMINGVAQSITYANSNNAPPASVDLEWGFSDQSTVGGTSAPAVENIQVDITRVNDAPVVNDSGVLQLTGITEDDLNNNGNTVAEILDSDTSVDPITDVDGDPEGIAITNFTGNGTWQFDTGTGWTDVGSVSATNALLLGESDRLRYVPDGENGETATIVFQAWDQTDGGVSGTKVDPSVSGGTTAFSDQVEAATIMVSDVNDAPTVDLDSNTLGRDFSITYQADSAPLSIVNGASISDIDSTIQSLTVRIVGLQNGSQEFIDSSSPPNINGPMIFNGTFTFSNAGTATNADFQTLLDSLAYFNFNSSATGVRMLEVVANDGVEDSLVATTTVNICLLYTSPSPRDRQKSRMPSSA